ncbi:MAG: hypothetical protein AB1589_05195 [Cyanobacteriota bacterium]
MTNAGISITRAPCCCSNSLNWLDCPAERVTKTVLPVRGGDEGCRLVGCRLVGCRLVGCRLAGCRLSSKGSTFNLSTSNSGEPSTFNSGELSTFNSSGDRK